jgi:hypothetical protein
MSEHRIKIASGNEGGQNNESNLTLWAMARLRPFRFAFFFRHQLHSIRLPQSQRRNVPQQRNRPMRQVATCEKKSQRRGACLLAASALMARTSRAISRQVSNSV